MMRRFPPVLLGLGSLCLLLSTTALADSTDRFGGKFDGRLKDLLSQIGDDQQVTVVISLDDDLPRGLARRLAIRQKQDRVIGAMRRAGRPGFQVLYRYETLNGFSARINKRLAQRLARHVDVEFVEAMPQHNRLDPESHPLTDVDLAQGAYDGTGAVIAIIDDGIDASHPAFNGKLLGGYDFGDFDDDPTIDCPSQSHGTSVAGVALGDGDGALGVAPGAKMVFLKIQSSSICGSTSLDGDVIAALDWATANKDTYGIDIISMSLGGGSYSSESSCDSSSGIYRQAVDNAAAAGITLIAASGNDGLCSAISRPACFSSVMSVGAVYDESLGNIGWCVSSSSCANTQFNWQCYPGRAAFENASADGVIAYSNSASFLDIVAPATCASTATPNNGSTDCFGGTSSATPFTSGAAALLVEAAGKGVLSPAEMRNTLVDNGDPVQDPKNSRVTPRVNANRAVDAVEGGTEPPPNQPPEASYIYDCTDLSCGFTDTSVDSDGTVNGWNWTFGDGSTSTQANPSHDYASAGSYTVTLTVTDDDDATDSRSRTVTVTAPQPNVGPTASFTSSCTDLDCQFTDTSSDSDGSIAGWSWAFGDGSTSSEMSPNHSYAAAGTYTVTLVVTDDDGASSANTATADVTVSEPADAVNLVASSTSQGWRWTAIVTNTSGGTLTGTWSRGGRASCSGNQCRLERIWVWYPSVVFTASSGERITVSRP